MGQRSNACQCLAVVSDVPITTFTATIDTVKLHGCQGAGESEGTARELDYASPLVCDHSA